MPLLELKNVASYYGSVQALKSVSLRVEQGEVVTLLGANGAGKSTTLRTISGLLRPASGEVWFDGRPIHDMAPEKIVRLGISHVPEGRGIFGRLTVEENLKLGAYTRKDQDGVRTDMGRAYELFPRLFERKTQQAGTLSGGEQQMLAIGRALMSRPKLLLLDEPSMGLAPMLVQKIFATIKKIAAEGMTLLLVEQNARLALEVSDRGYVMESGKIILTDSAQALLKDPKVQHAYLGG